MTKKQGRLFIVSLGIGDHDNMTLRARNMIDEADVILAMAFIREQYADLLVGKEVHDAGHALFTAMHGAKKGSEDDVRCIVNDAYKAGKTVAVLDFGDPTLYGPQSGYLKEFAHLNPQIIPGISSFNAANAALKKELSVMYDRPVILTEAMRENTLAQLAAVQGTMVLFTMRMDLPSVVLQLRAHYPEDTPIAVVVHAGFSKTEEVIHVTLGTLVAEMEQKQPTWAYLIYVGDFLRQSACPTK